MSFQNRSLVSQRTLTQPPGAKPKQERPLSFICQPSLLRCLKEQLLRGLPRERPRPRLFLLIPPRRTVPSVARLAALWWMDRTGPTSPRTTRTFSILITSSSRIAPNDSHYRRHTRWRRRWRGTKLAAVREKLGNESWHETLEDQVSLRSKQRFPRYRAAVFQAAELLENLFVGQGVPEASEQGGNVLFYVGVLAKLLQNPRSKRTDLSTCPVGCFHSMKLSGET
jgi:hypothetical protein